VVKELISNGNDNIQSLVFFVDPLLLLLLLLMHSLQFVKYVSCVNASSHSSSIGKQE
jgi:hypothetical protein